MSAKARIQSEFPDTHVNIIYTEDFFFIGV